MYQRKQPNGCSVAYCRNLLTVVAEEIAERNEAAGVASDVLVCDAAPDGTRDIGTTVSSREALAARRRAGVPDGPFVGVWQPPPTRPSATPPAPPPRRMRAVPRAGRYGRAARPSSPRTPGSRRKPPSVGGGDDDSGGGDPEPPPRLRLVPPPKRPTRYRFGCIPRELRS